MAVLLINHFVELSPGPSHNKVTLSSWKMLSHGGCKVTTAFVALTTCPPTGTARDRRDRDQLVKENGGNKMQTGKRGPVASQDHLNPFCPCFPKSSTSWMVVLMLSLF